VSVAVFDIGKTNLKLLVIDEAGHVLAQRSTPNVGVPGPPYLHVDLHAVESWLLAALAELSATHGIAALVTAAHGSGAVLVGETGPIMPMIDYEAEPPAEIDRAYLEVMPPFLERGSCLMGAASHVGRQMFWLAAAWPDAFAKARAVLTLPQYWAWRLSGVMASEITSLAAQSHLWDVRRGEPSALVRRLGWEHLLPPLRPAWDRLGPIRPEFAARTGLSPGTGVLNGIHDSSANLYRYQRAGLGNATLLSTGTWIVGLRAGLAPEHLVEARNMTLNADVTGRPVGGVLAMVGRELELLSQGQRGPVSLDDLQCVIDAGTLALPSFAGMDGVFPGSAGQGRMVGPGVPPSALALLYAALVAEICLDLLQAEGSVVIDGGFTAEPMFAAVVMRLRPDLDIQVEPVGGGTALGAALLASHGETVPPLRLAAAQPLALRDLQRYRDRWREMVSEARANGRGSA
jgi:sugar (pentulose or hexulose) kinase